MSFILDALKKSENERQRKLGPSLADVPVRRKKNERPWWALAIAALLVVNLGVLAVVLLRNGGAADAKPVQAPQRVDGSAASIQVEPPPPASSRVASQGSPQAAPTLTLPDPQRTAPITSPAVRPLAEAVRENPAESMDPVLTGPASAANVPVGPSIVKPIEPPSVAPLPSRPAYDPQVPGNEMLPTHGSLVAGGTNLPDMRLDIHVYSPTPSERFVYVNMRKYTEGQSLSEGATVERITSEGVVLNQNGLRFLLPRQ